MKKSLFLISLLSFSNLSQALETDQFLASSIDLKDSSSILSSYINNQIQNAVEHANNKSQRNYKCTQLADDVLSNLVGKYSISKISQFAKTSPDIERYPESSVSDREYFKMTIYEDASFLLKLAALARTININGIYLGTDKLGHFSLVGRNYYRKYLKNIEAKMDQEAAIKKAIIQGFSSEKGILGYGIGGVLSFGDLEANYQGFKFALDLCNKEKGYVELKDGKWAMSSKNKFDIKNYFNPKMDESYNLSVWRPYLYNKIQNKIKKEYCETRNNPKYLERIAKYEKINWESINDKLIKENILSKEKFNRRLESNTKFCD